VRLTGFAKAFITVVVLAVLAVAANHYLPGGLRGVFGRGGRAQGAPSSSPAPSTNSSISASTGLGERERAETPLFRLAGSNTVGAKLAPALVQAYLRKQGIASTVESVAPDEVVVRAAQTVVAISAHGTKTGFEALGNGSADIAMASRPIAADEATRAGSVGAAPREHVLALDGVAIVVHPDNPVRSLERRQIAAIFTGATRDWRDVGGDPHDIHVYVRDANSGTSDTFKDRVLQGAAVIAGARAFDSNAELAHQVASDPHGIGYVSLSEVGGARAVAVSEQGTLPIRPNRLTVAKEEYLLSRRLYLYTESGESGPAADFIRFALSDEGQAVVDETGFVGQRAMPVAPSTPAADLAGAPAEYRAFITGAKTLPFSFRFSPSSADLDTKGAQDLERLVKYYEANGAAQILLFGFADGSGSRTANQRLSQDRAESVARELRGSGVTPSVIRGFGATLFVDSNETAEGRARNRRVEVWVR
jgi:phosphate transport system substrate-binding protein